MRPRFTSGGVGSAPTGIAASRTLGFAGVRHVDDRERRVDGVEDVGRLGDPLLAGAERDALRDRAEAHRALHRAVRVERGEPEDLGLVRRRAGRAGRDAVRAGAGHDERRAVAARGDAVRRRHDAAERRGRRVEVDEASARRRRRRAVEERHAVVEHAVLERGEAVELVPRLGVRDDEAVAGRGDAVEQRADALDDRAGAPASPRRTRRGRGPARRGRGSRGRRCSGRSRSRRSCRGRTRRRRRRRRRSRRRSSSRTRSPRPTSLFSSSGTARQDARVVGRAARELGLVPRLERQHVELLVGDGHRARRLGADLEARRVDLGAARP